MNPHPAVQFSPDDWKQMMGLMVFVVATYVPLQVATVRAVKHPEARIAALLPLIPMLRVTIRGMQPDA